MDGRRACNRAYRAKVHDGGLVIYCYTVSKPMARKLHLILRNKQPACPVDGCMVPVYVAKRFPPERRVAALSFYHHGIVARFQPELADRLLAEAAENGFTARQIRALAEEEIGEKKPEKNRVILYLLDETYQQLLERAHGRPLEFVIAQMIVDGLSKPEAA